MKVLLVQLPVPNNRLSNLPLALGYLKASADAAHIPGLEVEILDREVQDRGGDAFLLDAILSRDPDLVGFSLYTWNSSRALHLAHELKKAAPEILTLAGGPEVNRDGDFVLAAADALDFLVLGEGERSFVELLQALNGASASKYAKLRSLELKTRNSELGTRNFSIPGLAYHPSGSHEWVFNAPRTAIEDVNLLPSVYLSGALEGFLGKFMMIELSRWCPSKCTFCYYGRQDLPLGGKRYFSLERLQQELLFGLEHGVEQVHFVEANFNTLPHLKQIYQTIKDTGANRQMRFYAEMRGEAIDEEEADHLAECNFGIVECGLQSAVPEVLARVRRKNHLPRLVRGVHLLRERGVEVFLDAILGLPGDTPDTFRQTLNFIEDNGLAPYDLFHLQILPGTQLKAEAEAGNHGLQWQSAPPYFALQTSELSFEQICELRRETLRRKGDASSEIQGLPLPGPFSLIAPFSGERSSANHKETVFSGDLWADATRLYKDTSPVERLVLDFSSFIPHHSSLIPVSRRLASEVTLWLRLGNVDVAKLKVAQQALETLSAPNPSGVWHIFVEGDRPLTREERAQLAKGVQHEVGYLDRLAVFALEERDPARFAEWPSVGLYEIVPWSINFVEMAGPKTVWQLEFSGEEPVEQWRGQLEAATKASSYGLQLVFPSAVSTGKVQALLSGFAADDKIIFMADSAIAAGLISAQQEDTSSLVFPLTLIIENGNEYLLQPETAELERGALRWALAQRLSRA